MKRQRDYSNLKESERVWDAVDMNSTHVKDYSLKHVCGTMWRLTDYEIHKRFVHIFIGNQEWIGRSLDLTDKINEMADESDDDNYFPRGMFKLDGLYKHELVVDTRGVGQECLQDHLAQVSIGENTALIDLEELLKATRYA